MLRTRSADADRECSQSLLHPAHSSASGPSRLSNFKPRGAAGAKASDDLLADDRATLCVCVLCLGGFLILSMVSGTLDDQWSLNESIFFAVQVCLDRLSIRPVLASLARRRSLDAVSCRYGQQRGHAR